MTRLLLVGEGDFTFALSLVQNSRKGALELTATGFDSLAEVKAKYRDAPSTLAKLAAGGCVVCHGVDATALGAFEGGRFDDVVFSHPHLGVEDCGMHFGLLAHYFWAAKRVAPVVRVTLAGGQARLWRCDAAARRSGLVRVGKSPFLDAAFPGYTRRRSLRGASFRARTPEASVTLSYALRGASVEDDATRPAWSAFEIRETDVGCPECGRRCRDERALKTHVKDAHGGVASSEATRTTPPPPIAALGPGSDDEERDGGGDADETRVGALGNCDVCGAAFDTDAERDAHAFRPAEPATLACACGKVYRNERALEQHAKSGSCAAVRRRVKIHYSHGLEAGPGGFKAEQCRAWADVTAPDMRVSLWNPYAPNSFAAKVLSRLAAFDFGDILRGAKRDALVACADVQRHALKRASPDILFSSSWGSAVALKLLADRDFDGPAVLLCPAHRVLLDERDADDLERRVAALPKHVKRSCVLVHGTADATVDVSHSKALSETAGIDLVLVDGGSHGLGKPTADGTLFAILLDRLHIHRKNRKGSQRDARLPKDVFLLDGLPAPPPVA